MPPASSASSPAARKLSSGPHGNLQLAAAVIESYSLELREGEGFLGDLASRTAFGRMLDAWRQLFRSLDGSDPLGDLPSGRVGRSQLDALVKAGGPAADTIRAAAKDYALQLAHVIPRFLRQKAWHGVERIVIGGGFQQSAVGVQAIGRTVQLLRGQKVEVALRTLHHHADEGGLIGWVHLAPPEVLALGDAILAVDIGGTNLRCGIVRMRLDKAADFSRADVVFRTKWKHADDEEATRREDVVDGLADRLLQLIVQAGEDGIRLAPFIGVACPGLICQDGSIAGGTQNLPGNWESTRFHLPQRLCGRISHIGGRPTQVLMHNDAVVQGLSELPFTRDVKRWAVLTIGTGLGNASYTNR